MFYAFTVAVVSINFYCWWKLRCAFLRSQTPAAYLLLFLMLFALFTPVWSRIIFHESVPSFIIQAGWIWLAWAFWLFTAFLPCDLWNCAVRLAALLHFDMASAIAKLCLSPRTCGVIALSFTAFATIWGMFEASALKIQNIEIQSDSIPSGTVFRIGFISDMHIGPAASKARFNKTLETLRASNCDLILSAGDLIDGHGKRESDMAEQLRDIKPPCGKYAVFGNHDVYSSLDFSRECHGIAGFNLLENKSATPQPWLFIYGENDPAAGWHPGFKSNAKNTEYPEIPDNCFSILLKHRPEYNADSPFTLQLSGHSHGGQIFPFSLLVRLQHPFKESRLHKMENGKMLYVSMGTGVWGPPFRFLARPEITIINIKEKIL